MRDRATFCIKTIHRPRCCAALIRSIYEHCGNQRPAIHVLDDGRPDLRFSKHCPGEACLVDRLVETEYDIGLSAGRNRLLDLGDTPIIVFADDDHLVTKHTRLGELVAQLDRYHDLDLLAAKSGRDGAPRLMHVKDVSFRQACMNLFEASGIVGCRGETSWRTADGHEKETWDTCAA